LLAAELPFRKIIGVELNEGLARIAQRNVTLWNRLARPRAKIRVVHEDAAAFRWPRTPLLVYFNNPFDCAMVELLASRLAAAAASGPGLLDLLYVNPAWRGHAHSPRILQALMERANPNGRSRSEGRSLRREVRPRCGVPVLRQQMKKERKRACRPPPHLNISK